MTDKITRLWNEAAQLARMIDQAESGVTLADFEPDEKGASEIDVTVDRLPHLRQKLLFTKQQIATEEARLAQGS